jgi:hypothetical protein
MSSLANISIRFKADLKQFSSQMQNVDRRLKKVGKRLSSIGSSMSMNFTAPVVAGLALVTKGTEELRSDLGRLETNALLAGEGLNFIRDQLKEVQAITGETDSSVEGLSNLLAAGFKGENLTRALDNISGAAVKFSDTLKFEGIADGLQETLATGKAIGPFSELLERSGINLDDFNAGLAESSRLGEEQTFILNTLASTGLEEVNKKYRENNKDVTEAKKSQLAFQMAIADLAKTLQPIVTRITEFVTRLVTAFNDLDPSIKNIALVVVGLLAAIGPSLAALGFLLSTVIPGLFTAFGLLSAPILAVVAAVVAIGVAIYKHWEPIKKTVLDIANYFIDLYNESVIVRVGVEAIALQFKILYEAAKLVFNGLITIIKGWWTQTKATFSLFGEAFKAIITGNFKELPRILARNLAKTQKNFTKTLAGISNDVKNFNVGLQESISDSIDNIAGRKKLELSADVTVDAVKISEKGSGELNSAMSGQGGRPQIQSASTLQSRGLMSTGIGSELRADGAIIDEETTKINENLAMFNIKARETLEQASLGFAEGFGKIIGNIATGNVGMEALLGLLLNTFGNIAIRLGKLALGIGATIEAIEAALENLSGITAIAAGIALIALGTIAKSAAANIAESGGGGQVAFADGGIVSGPVNALVGEYAGAKNNPEVITPLNKLKSMLGDSIGGDMSQIEVFGTMSGQNILLSSSRAQKYRNRRG